MAMAAWHLEKFHFAAGHPNLKVYWQIFISPPWSGRDFSEQ
jgi:hypothetical protein